MTIIWDLFFLADTTILHAKYCFLIVYNVLINKGTITFGDILPLPLLVHCENYHLISKKIRNLATTYCFLFAYINSKNTLAVDFSLTNLSG